MLDHWMSAATIFLSGYAVTLAYSPSAANFSRSWSATKSPVLVLQPILRALGLWPILHALGLYLLLPNVVLQPLSNVVDVEVLPLYFLKHQHRSMPQVLSNQFCPHSVSNESKREAREGVM